METTIFKFYEVGIRLTKTMDDGRQKKVTEKYVFKAVPFTDAEKQAVQLADDYRFEEFEVVSEKTVNYAYIIGDDNNRANSPMWYKVKISHEIETVGNNGLKRSVSKKNLLVLADSVDDAKKEAENFYDKKFPGDNVLCTSVQESSIVDVVGIAEDE